MSVDFTGYRLMRSNPRARQFVAPRVGKGVLPAKVDLRPYMTPVEQQGDTNSCTANAVAGAYEYLLKKFSGDPRGHFDVSRLFVYYNARWRDNVHDEDEGSAIQSAMHSLEAFGACSEGTWPFDERKVLAKPSKRAYTEAAPLRIKDMHHVPIQLQTWKQSLAAGFPIVFGAALFESFDDSNKRSGVVPMPDPRDVARGDHGLHAMLCVGYSEVDKVFMVRNSWGADWGDEGYCYMPYNYLMSPQLNCDDNWVIRVGDGKIPDPEETWVADDKSVLNDGRGVTFDINPFRPDAYRGFDVFSLFPVMEYVVKVPGEFAEWVEEFQVDEEELGWVELLEDRASAQEDEEEEETEEDEDEDDEEEDEDEEEEDEEEYEEEEEEEDDDEEDDDEEEDDEEEYEEEEEEEDDDEDDE